MDNARLYEAAQRAAEERQGLLESERAAHTASERMSALKDQFLATLSHELRTPLISDIGMPDVDGYELLRRARLAASASRHSFAAIALTAFAR